MKPFVGLAAALAFLSPTSAMSAEFLCSGSCYTARATSNVNGIQMLDGGNDGPTNASVTQNWVSNSSFSNMFASADLATGAMRVRIDTNYAGSVNARLGEDFVFELPDHLSSADVTVTWTVEGFNDYRGGRANGLGAHFQLSGVGARTIRFNDLNFQFQNPIYLDFVSEGFHRYTFSDTFTVNRNQLFTIDTSISAGISGAGTMDYGNTAFFNFALPEGVRINSSSGVLLSRPIQAGVPEPASWTMMILGFGGAGVAIRRRRGRAAHA